MDIVKVGKAIAYLRKRAGFTQKDLANRLGVSDKAVSKWERGIGLPDITNFGKLSILLDTDTDSLLAGDVIHHDDRWRGVLVLSENPYGLGADTVLYDKPLSHYLLCYFLLVGIRDIYVVSDQKNWNFINLEYEGGTPIGFTLHYCGSTFVDVQNKITVDTSFSNLMVIFGRSFIFGVDQTRFFQRAMAHKDRTTILSLPRKVDDAISALSFNDEMQIVNANHANKTYTQYDYHEIPVLFCSRKFFIEKFTSNPVDIYAPFTINMNRCNDELIYTEVLDRGYIEISVDTPDDVINVSELVRLIQNACGMNIYCIEEIAWRRGLIDIKRLQAQGLKGPNKNYGAYILSLANRFGDKI